MALSSTAASAGQIRQPQIAFYGAVVTAQGMWQDTTKIQALQDLPTPNSQVKLHVLPRIDKLLPTLHPWSFHKNNVLAQTTCQVGLEPLKRCSLPALQGQELPDPPQYYPCVL